jgi:hypothetical protein
MRVQFYVLAAVVVLAMEPAAAINKCTGADGRVTFQDAACAGAKSERLDVRPASGNPPASSAAQAASSSSNPPQTEAARLEGIISASQRARRSRDLKERLLPDAERDLREHRAGCEQKQKTLAAQQYIYRQNLYGKTHAAQIASEMAASAALCDTKGRELKERVDSLAKECATLNSRG